MKTTFLSIILLNLLFALSFNQSCLNQTNDGPAAPTPEKLEINEAKYVYITGTCAPWDGPAFTIQVTDTPQECSEIKPPYLRITIWKDISGVFGKAIHFSE